MSTDRPDIKLGAAIGADDTIARLQQLASQLERGEVACAAVRIIKPDGTWEDVVLGNGTAKQREEALRTLKESNRSAN